jgi:type IV pilus assembly protein PilM
MASERHDRPQLACEISADQVIAARAGDHRRALGGCSARTLPEGCVAPDLTEANVLRSDALRDAISDALDAVAGRSRDVIAVLPDAAARVVLLDFDTLPEKPDEAAAVVRFRLKKSMPFDVDRARVAYHAQPASPGVRVIATVALTSVIDEYESAFRHAGYAPGVVVPSMLATLGAVDAARPTMALKVDSFTTSMAILDQAQLLLFRTLENTRGLNITGDQLAEDVYPSVVFFQDTYRLNIERIYVGGLPSSDAVLSALQAQTGVEVRDLVSSRDVDAAVNGVPRSRLGGVLGALA